MNNQDIESLYKVFLEHPSICTDSRQVEQGDFFVALPGERVDGNTFAEAALERGAAVALVSDPSLAERDERCIYTEDTLLALQQLAKRHRESFKIPLIAITGSNGKTTTKELCAVVLSQRYKVLYTEGNFNNHLGMPLTLLRLNDEHEIAVVEIGINHPGEMAPLADIARPTHALITGIGKAHLEGFGSLEGTLREKSILAERAYESGGVVFLNLDDPLLRERWSDEAQVTYGLADGSYDKEPDFKATILREQPYLSLRISCSLGEQDIATHLVGRYNYHNVLAAFAVGVTFGLTMPTIANAIESYTPTNDRSQMVRLPRHISLIMDAYNANPSSMRAAIENLFTAPEPAKFAILGDMLELGDVSDEEHLEIMRLMEGEPEITTLYVGETFYRLASPETMAFRDIEGLRSFLEVIEVPDESVWLLKGSHRIGLDRLKDTLSMKADEGVSGSDTYTLPTSKFRY